jgi:hypothetical protein
MKIVSLKPPHLHSNVTAVRGVTLAPLAADKRMTMIFAVSNALQMFDYNCKHGGGETLSECIAHI